MFVKLVLVAALSISQTCVAYETITHSRITEEVITASSLNTKLPAYGLKGTADELTDDNLRGTFGFLAYFRFTPLYNDPFTAPKCIDSGVFKPSSVADLIDTGVFCEDAVDNFNGVLVPRFVYHFYDPAHAGAGFRNGVSSATWGLEPVSVPIQTYSYPDFKRYLAEAVTTVGIVERRRTMSKAFRSLGHVVHLIEDLAQPQHTRDDGHGVPPSLYEVYTDKVASSLVYIGYSPPALPGPRVMDLWHSDAGRGLSDYSNRGFITAGKNFRGTADDIKAHPDYPDPSGAGAVLHKTQIQDLSSSSGCPGEDIPKSLIGDVTFIETQVPDNVLGTSATNPRMSTYSLFDEDLKHYGYSKTFSVNRFTFCEAQRLLLPRAAAYGAALLNYAFRGTLTLSVPSDGIVAISNLVEETCIGPCAFTQLKIRAVNSTGEGETVGAGRVTGVVRYHRNQCHRGDLSGEPGTPTWSAECRIPVEIQALNEYVSVSTPIEVNGISMTEASTFMLAFPDGIPLDASDVYVQLLFEGRLGNEPDGIAIGSIDLAEPTFLTFNNAYDFIGVYGSDGSFLRTERLAPATGPDPGYYSLVDFKLDAYAPNGPPVRLASFKRLDPGYYYRVAVLTDATQLTYTVEYNYASNHKRFFQVLTTATAKLQLDDSNIWWYGDEYVTLRRADATQWIYQFGADGATLYWSDGYRCETGATGCSPVDVVVDDQIRRYPPFAQATPLPMTIDFYATP